MPPSDDDVIDALEKTAAAATAMADSELPPELALVAAALPLGGLLVRAVTWKGRRLDGATANPESEWIVAMVPVVKKLVRSEAEMRERLERLEREFPRQRVLRNYFFEAVREAIDDRRSMLAAGAASTFAGEHSVEDAARVERVLRMLDEEDVALLRRLERAHPGGRGFALADLRQGQLWGSQLVASGCLLTFTEVAAGSIPTARITPLGELVVRIVGDVMG